MEAKIAIVSGRIVWVAGDLFVGEEERIYGTNQPKIDPKSGKQNTVFRFGLAVNKTELADPTKGAIWQAMHEIARALYPSGNIPPGFAWKYKDGDGADDKGKPFNQREGYAGCLVFTLSTNIQPRFFRWENGQNVQVIDGIKCGDYVNVQVKVNGQISGKPGLYLNQMAVQLVVVGKEIINAPSADQVFGMAAPALPTNYVPPEQPVMPNIATPAPIAPVAPTPRYGVVPQAFQPPPGGHALPMHAVPAAGSIPAPMAPTGVQMNGIPAPTTVGPAPTAFPSSGMPPIPGR